MILENQQSSTPQLQKLLMTDNSINLLNNLYKICNWKLSGLLDQNYAIVIKNIIVPP